MFTRVTGYAYAIYHSHEYFLQKYSSSTEMLTVNFSIDHDHRIKRKCNRFITPPVSFLTAEGKTIGTTPFFNNFFKFCFRFPREMSIR